MSKKLPLVSAAQTTGKNDFWIPHPKYAGDIGQTIKWNEKFHLRPWIPFIPRAIL
jgi:hypothetical protein